VKIPDSFVEQLIAALRRHGESGDVRLMGPTPDLLELRGPPKRGRYLPDVYKRWLRAPAAERDAIVDEFGRLRFGSNVMTADAGAVTDVDIRQDAIACCGDGVFVLLCCPACRAVWLHCEPNGHSWVDLTTTPRKLERPRADKCPSCGKALRFDEGLAALLPAREDVLAAGLERYLVQR
jgi:hypothetical protein